MLPALLAAAGLASGVGAPAPVESYDSLRVAVTRPAADTLALRVVPRATLAVHGDGHGQVIEPAGLAIDAFGQCVVSDAALHRLTRFDAKGGWVGEAGSLGSDPGQLRRPGALAMLGTLSVAVLDEDNRRVVGYDRFGKLQGVLVDFEEATLADAIGHVTPIGLAADRGGAFYVADADRDRLLAFDFSGRFLRVVGGFGARPGSFRGLRGVAVTPRGEIVTAERVSARVQRLDAGGRVAASWALDVQPGRGALPMAVDDSSRVAVADEATGRLWVFDAHGRLLAALAGLERPRALAYAPDGTLVVAEARAGRVRRYALDPAAPPAPSTAPEE